MICLSITYTSSIANQQRMIQMFHNTPVTYRWKVNRQSTENITDAARFATADLCVRIKSRPDKQKKTKIPTDASGWRLSVYTAPSPEVFTDTIHSNYIFWVTLLVVLLFESRLGKQNFIQIKKQKETQDFVCLKYPSTPIIFSYKNILIME